MSKAIELIENSTEKLIVAMEEGSDEWKVLQEIKNKDIDILLWYKFLIGAILESRSIDLWKDIKGFKFSHREDEEKINELLGNADGFDLNKYLTEFLKNK